MNLSGHDYIVLVLQAMAIICALYLIHKAYTAPGRNKELNGAVGAMGLGAVCGLFAGVIGFLLKRVRISLYRL